MRTQFIRANGCAWLIAVGVILMSFDAASAASVRVALVGSQGVGLAGGVVALAEAQLSARDGLEILDRQHVDRVLQEQKLAVGGLVDAAGAVKAGALLAVDLFVVVEQSEDGKDTLGCVIYDTGTGLRLWDAALAAKELEGVVEEVVSAVDRAVTRRAAGPDGHCQGRVWFGEWQSAEGRLGSTRLEAGEAVFVPVDLPQLAKSEPSAEWIVTPVDERRFLWSNHRRLWLVTPQASHDDSPPSNDHR